MDSLKEVFFFLVNLSKRLRLENTRVYSVISHTQASVQPWSNLIAIYLGKAPSKLQRNLIKSIPNLKFVHLNMKDHMNSVGPLIVRWSAEPATDQHTVNWRNHKIKQRMRDLWKRLSITHARTRSLQASSTWFCWSYQNNTRSSSSLCSNPRVFVYLSELYDSNRGWVVNENLIIWLSKDF